MIHKVRAKAVYSLTCAGGKIGKQQFIHDGKAVKSGIQDNNGPVSPVVLPYIPVNRGYGADLVTNFSTHIQLLKDTESSIPLTLMGEGAILCSGAKIDFPSPKTND